VILESLRLPLRRGTFLPSTGFSHMRKDRYDWPRVGGSVVVWLVIAVIAGAGLVGALDPGSITALVAAEL
jgi:hypothetical protein